MTAHTHTTRVPGCYRCELGVDEVLSALAVERDELETERDRYREALNTLARWHGPLTAADAGTMRMTARAAIDAASSRNEATS